MASSGAGGPLPFLGALARSARPEDRLLWLRVAVDYFVSGATPGAELSAEFEANFSTCLARANEEYRMDLARKLISRGNAPSYLLGAIEALGGDAALFVLERARGLPRERLLADARRSGLARAVARRDDLDDELIWAILLGRDPEARLALVENPSAPLSAAHYQSLAERARADVAAGGDRRLAETLLARTPTRAEFAPLFLEANPNQRTLILLAVQRSELGQPRRAAAPGASAEAIAALERLALAGETELFTRALAETLGCSETLAERIAADRSGEPLAVSLAAIGAPNDVSVRILTSNDIREGADYRRIGALARLQDALSPSTARRVIAAILDDPGTREARDLARERAGPSARADAPPPIERRPRTLPGASTREETLSAPVMRRRRAFAFLAANRPLEDKR